MKKKLGAILLVVALALALGVVPAAPVLAADYTDSYYSDSATTEAAGYTIIDPSADPVNEASYEGSWSSAVDLSNPLPGVWRTDNSIPHDTLNSFWVSNADGVEGAGTQGTKTDDQWRLFREEISVPSWAVNISGQLWMAADNCMITYPDDTGTVVHEAGDIYGPVPSSDPKPVYYDPWNGPYSFTPQQGDNTLYFVVRNWANLGTYPGNPTGLLYRVEVEYDVPSLGELSPTPAYNPVCTEHTVSVTIDPAEEGVEVHFDIDGPNSSKSGSATTGADGIARFTYHGENPGTDVVTAYIDLDGEDDLDVGEPTSTNTATKYWLEHFVTGGGIITEGRGKTAARITFGGNVGFTLEGDIVGQWNIVFHNVNNDAIDKGHFHTTQFTELYFGNVDACPEPDPPDAEYNYAHFVAFGEFNGVPGWKVRFNMTDYGEGKRVDPDGIRIRLYNTSNVVVYDSSDSGSPVGDFPNQGICATANRTWLDGGNIQIHPPEIPTP